MRRKLIALALLTCGAVIIPLGVARANHSCVSYSATAPVIGTRSDTKCGPGTGTRPFRYWYCHSTPPAGEAFCVVVDAHTP